MKAPKKNTTTLILPNAVVNLNRCLVLCLFCMCFFRVLAVVNATFAILLIENCLKPIYEASLHIENVSTHFALRCS